jgi:hypothetical protein
MTEQKALHQCPCRLRTAARGHAAVGLVDHDIEAVGDRARRVGQRFPDQVLPAVVAAEVNPPLFAGEVAVLQAGVNLG